MPPRRSGDAARGRVLGYVAAVFSSNSPDEIRTLLDEIEAPQPFRVRLKVLYASSHSVLDVFRNLAARGIVRTLTTNGPGFALRSANPELSEEFQQGKSGSAPVDGPSVPVYFAVLPTAQAHVSVVATVCERPEWLLLLRSIQREYPALVPINLSQREVLRSVTSLRHRVRATHDLRVRQLSAREIVESAGGVSRTKSVLEWTDEDWETAVSLAAERRQLINSITLAFHRRASDQINVNPSAICRITRRGEVEVTGRFALLWQTVVADVAAAGEQKLSFYSKRGLRENEYKPRPLTIVYPAPVLGDIAEIRRLVDVLMKYPQSMHAVQHGNPYAYVQVADAFDGSSFDVWAVSEDRVTIVPRLKATEAAVDRLIQYLFEAFREGQLENYGVS